MGPVGPRRSRRAEPIRQTLYKGDMISVVRPPADKKAMKAFKPMPEGDRRTIAAFLAGEAAEVKDPAHDAQGAKMISQRCTSCHLFRGQTDTTRPRGPSSRDGEASHGEGADCEPGPTPPIVRGPMAADRKGHMPRFRRQARAGNITLLAAWVRKKARGEK